MKLDVLAIGAHLDDVELGCGATIAKEISRSLGYNEKDMGYYQNIKERKEFSFQGNPDAMVYDGSGAKRKNQ